jgi:hypothetical protein
MKLEEFRFGKGHSLNAQKILTGIKRTTANETGQAKRRKYNFASKAEETSLTPKRPMTESVDDNKETLDQVIERVRNMINEYLKKR